MSYIAWHSERADTVHVRGWERAWMGSFVRDIAAAFLPQHGDGLAARINPAHRLAEAERVQVNDVALALSYGLSWDPDVLVDHDGAPLAGFDLQLNTVLAVGSAPACLFARLHGQCELHAYVEGPHRAWLADVIDAGRASGLYRAGAGWEDVAVLLRSRDDGPVVTSYSVTAGFPDAPPVWEPPAVDEDGEPDHDAWFDLPEHEQWRIALAALRDEPARGLEMRPDRLRAPFGHERSLIDLFVVSPATART